MPDSVSRLADPDTLQSDLDLSNTASWSVYKSSSISGSPPLSSRRGSNAGNLRSFLLRIFQPIRAKTVESTEKLFLILSWYDLFLSTLK